MQSKCVLVLGALLKFSRSRPKTNAKQMCSRARGFAQVLSFKAKDECKNKCVLVLGALLKFSIKGQRRTAMSAKMTRKTRPEARCGRLARHAHQARHRALVLETTVNGTESETVMRTCCSTSCCDTYECLDSESARPRLRNQVSDLIKGVVPRRSDPTQRNKMLNRLNPSPPHQCKVHRWIGFQNTLWLRG
jgi:hypothetical protein